MLRKLFCKIFGHDHQTIEQGKIFIERCRICGDEEYIDGGYK
jgi:hypothetical protein